MAARAVLITGCSSGIGRDAALTLRERGWRVFAACRREEDCVALRAEGFESPRIDYEDEASVETGAAEALDAAGGRIDALFNNGAYAVPGFIEDLPTDALRANFEANFFGWHALTRRVLPAMRAAGAGRIVQCSSVLGFAAVRWRGSYCATKFALEGYTDALRLELRGAPIRVSIIEPGPIDTRFNANAVAQFRRWVDPQRSPHREELGRIAERYASDAKRSPFELQPAAVTRSLIHALESPRPRTRYRVTTPTLAMAALKRLAPTALLDALLARQ